MSIPVLNNIDLHKNQILNAVLQIIAGNHGSPVEGLIWYDSTADKVKYRDNDGNETVVSQAVLDTAVALLQPLSEKAQANGYASLDGAGRVPASQLPVSAMEYKGTWNATTNTPALADGTGSTGDLYRVSTAGTQDLGAGNIEFAVGDYVIYNGATWEKGDTTDAVSSVAGRTGAVVLVKADVGLGNVDNTTDANKPVSTATQAALDAHTGDAVDAHDASAISFAPTGTLAATDVQAAIAELLAEAGAGTVTKHAETITGNAVLTTFTVTHNRNTLDVTCTVWKASNGAEVIVDKAKTGVNAIDVTFGIAPADGEAFRVVVTG